jgi:hypothetical protein
MTDDLIVGIYKYLQYIVDRQIDQGNTGWEDSETHRSYTAFASLMALSMKKSYVFLED